ncbi:MAG TPA: WG repeat-containing protein, partial [Blastocatellia bacterium]|nr:WG repeat-containing protein [Blastocatellia bacterium]
MNMRITALPLVYFAFSALLLSSYGQDNTGGLYPVTQNGKWFYINRAGEIAIKPAFDDAHAFSDGLAAVQIGSKWGYIDK